MAEQLRTGLLEQQQRAATRVFEGRPVEFFPHNVSLPPPADKSEKPRKPARNLRDERVRAIWRLHDAGRSLFHIKTVVSTSYGTLRRVLSEPRPPEPQTPAQVEPTPAADQQPPEAPAACTPAPAPSKAEGQRMGLLVWTDRMDRYEFSAMPEQCKPRKSRRRIKVVTHSQFREAYGNCIPRYYTPQYSKPVKRAIREEFEQLFVR